MEGSEVEGEYMAALRGSNSKQWQSMTSAEAFKPTNYSYSYATSGFDGPNFREGVCYRCKKEGHWAKDCPMPAVGAPGSMNIPPVSDSSVPQKYCPCGAGVCAVRVSSTPKNPGRQFYCCPKPQDAGKCRFFEWCDGAATGQGGVQSSPGNQQSNEPEFKCVTCGQPCLVLTAKTEKNSGRKFYKCQKTEACNAFKWCDELTASPGSKTQTPSYGNVPSKNPSAGYGSPTAYPGPPSPYSHSPGGYRAPGASGGYGMPAGGYGGNFGSPQGMGYQAGPPQSTWTSGAGSGRVGSCYKCGEPGHYANSCPLGK